MTVMTEPSIRLNPHLTTRHITALRHYLDELIESCIEHGGPDAVSFAAFGEVLADLEAESAQETIELTGIVRGDTIVFDQPRAAITVKDNEIFLRGTKLVIKLREVQLAV